MKPIINAEEFDECSKEEQELYWLCQHCGNFVLDSWSTKCLCEEG